VELLIASVVAAVVLSGAYGWMWGLGALARTTDDRAQACTVAGVVTRTVLEDVGGAVAVLAPSAGRDPAASLALLHDGAATAPESVTVVWDAGRGVVWRNAPGTYVADHVRSLRVGFLLADGREVDGAAMTAADWADVTGVHADVVVAVGAAIVERRVFCALGAAA
jgi:hypothetical protein